MVIQLRKNYLKAQSDNLPEVTVQMLCDYFRDNECFNIEETAGTKLERYEKTLLHFLEH